MQILRSVYDNGWNVIVEVALVVVVAVAMVHETVYFQVLHQYEFLGVHDRLYRLYSVFLNSVCGCWAIFGVEGF